MDFFEENSIRFSPNKTQIQKDTHHSRFKEELNKINLINDTVNNHFLIL